MVERNVAERNVAEQDDHSGAVTVPPLIFAAAFAVGLVLDRIWPAPLMPEAVQYALAAILAAASLAVAAATVLMFRKHRTTIHVHRPSTALITGGPFRFSRNPAYVALVLLYAAAAIAVDSAWILVMLVPAIIVLQQGVIVREERYLERRFGDVYRDYRTRVRRWL